MEKHGKYVSCVKASAMSVLFACVSTVFAYANDARIILSAIAVDIAADCVTDSVADLWRL